MKTEKMLAASAAAIFALSGAAVVAYANETNTETNPEQGNTESESSAASSESTAASTSTSTSTGQGGGNQGGGSAGTPIEGKTNSIKFGSTTTTVGGKVSDGNGGEADFDKSRITDDITGEVGDGVTATIAKKDALKLKGACEVRASVSSVEEGDDDMVDTGEDTVIAGLDLNKDLVAKLAKTKAAETMVINVKVGIDDKVKSTIGKPLTITVPDTFKGAKVYHVNSDGTVTKITDYSTDQLIGTNLYQTTFTTTNFSPFIITTADLKSSANPDAASDEAAASDAADGTNANTGIALAIAPVVLAAGAVAVVAFKKKH